MISGSSSPQIYGVFIWWEMGEKTMVNGGFDGNFNVFFFFNGWLVVTGTMEFYIFPNSWDDDPI
jgi:hypothetical protein